MKPLGIRHTVAAVAAGVVVAWAVTPAPAWAHVEVSADKPRAGARDVTITFDGEAESSSAGIVSERIVLPVGISPQDVRLVKAPKGWTLTPGSDGYTVGGKALPVGENAVHSILVPQLPSDARELAFKTLESYSNGKVSRWIGLPTAEDPEPDNPAPILKLRPATAVATTAAPPTSAAPAPSPSPTALTTPATSAAAAAPQPDAGGIGAGWWIALAAIAVAGVVAVVLLRRRRNGSPG